MTISPGGLRVDVDGTWLRTILTRRRATSFREDGPTDGELEAILTAAVTVADGRDVRPWRFTIIDDTARLRFADLVRDAIAATGDERLAAWARHSMRSAPTVIAVVAHLDAGACVPVREQLASSTAAAYVISLAAHELGLGSRWRTIANGDHPLLRAALAMAPDDLLIGWVELGRVPTAHEADPDPPIPLVDVVQVMADDGTTRPFGGQKRMVRRRRQRTR